MEPIICFRNSIQFNVTSSSTSIRILISFGELNVRKDVVRSTCKTRNSSSSAMEQIQEVKNNIFVMATSESQQPSKICGHNFNILCKKNRQPVDWISDLFETVVETKSKPKANKLNGHPRSKVPEETSLAAVRGPLNLKLL